MNQKVFKTDKKNVLKWYFIFCLFVLAASIVFKREDFLITLPMGAVASFYDFYFKIVVDGEAITRYNWGLKKTIKWSCVTLFEYKKGDADTPDYFYIYPDCGYIRFEKKN